MLFKPKRDVWMAIPIWLLMLGNVKVLYDAIIVHSILAMIIGVLLSIWLNTSYLIEEESLKI